MPKHTIVALFCFALPGLFVGASLNAQVPVKLVPQIGAQVDQSSQRIIGGNTAPDGQYPYQVQVYTSSRFCSGSIISPAWILTAANCVAGLNPASLIIKAGSNTRGDGATYQISEIHAHDQFNPDTNANDIALLKVNGQIAYTNKVNRIQLTLLPPLSGASLVSSGWGATSYPGNGPSQYLQYIGLQSIDILTCQQQLAGIPVSATGNTCTTAPVGQGLCAGDSGNPLVTQGGVLVGIASFTVPPCASGNPDVFTSVFAYRVWILALTGTLV